MGKELLLEIGTEEIPAAFISEALLCISTVADLGIRALSADRTISDILTGLYPN
jgi:glycyl-tRNA synthetase beta subunit